MKIKEMREMGIAELQQKTGELRKEYLHLRFQQANQQLKNPLKLREVRRQIARMLTIIKEKKQ
jgi:large subunit ribosomal protein L29